MRQTSEKSFEEAHKFIVRVDLNKYLQNKTCIDKIKERVELKTPYYELL